MAKKAPHRLYLTEEQIPTAWYNLRADMKEKPEPMLNPATGKPVSEEDLYPVFCKELAHQEMDNDTQYIEIPPEVLEMYKNYRPSPLCRAYNLEKALDTPAHSPGLLCQEAGTERCDNGNRRRSVGHSPFGSLLLFRPAPGSFHGEGFL